MRDARIPLLSVAAALLLIGALAGCATSRPAAKHSGVIEVAASINAWGSVLTQLGGIHVHETSIITNPDTDPHAYEPTPADARAISDAALFVQNGIGYDNWAAQTLAASPNASRRVIDVGSLVHVGQGGNPHRWYAPADVEAVADAITADLIALDPADKAYFTEQRTSFENVGLSEYHHLIATIKTNYTAVRVGASESIFAPLATALGLDLVTPPSFLKAISEGTDPSAADKAKIDEQINTNQIAVYVYNSQNSTPDVAAQVRAARNRGIPVVAVTETLSPANATFQQWQSDQLTALAGALHQAVGR